LKAGRVAKGKTFAKWNGVKRGKIDIQIELKIYWKNK
jgi:hypothetical protein